MSEHVEAIAQAEHDLAALGELVAPRVDCLCYHDEGFVEAHKLPMLFDVVPRAEYLFSSDPAAVPDAKAQQLAQPRPLPDAPVWWINIDHPDTVLLESLTDLYGVHPLVLEDIMAPLPRSKMEDWRSSIYLSVQLPTLSAGSPKRVTLPMILGPGFLITFVAPESSIYRAIRGRIEHNQGRLRKRGADALFAAFLDESIERAFPVIELMESEIEDLEEAILTNSRSGKLEEILELKRFTTSMRHYLWPVSDLLMSLYRMPTGLFNDDVRLILRDLVDHSRHLVEVSASLRDMAGDLLDVYHTASAGTMNKVMKVLTLISTIFIPLTFVAGLYGMNFRYMPELDVPWAYPLVLACMAIISLGMVAFFKLRKWI